MSQTKNNNNFLRKYQWLEEGEKTTGQLYHKSDYDLTSYLFFKKELKLNHGKTTELELKEMGFTLDLSLTSSTSSGKSINILVLFIYKMRGRNRLLM